MYLVNFTVCRILGLKQQCGRHSNRFHVWGPAARTRGAPTRARRPRARTSASGELAGKRSDLKARLAIPIYRPAEYSARFGSAKKAAYWPPSFFLLILRQVSGCMSKPTICNESETRAPHARREKNRSRCRANLSHFPQPE